MSSKLAGTRARQRVLPNTRTHARTHAGWSQTLGRHNHGPAFFNDPWSGFYQLGAAVFSQAHFTQFTSVTTRT